jgi:hypothetical protein
MYRGHISNAPPLSLMNTLQWTFGVVDQIRKFFLFISLSNSMIGIMSHRANDNPVYSLSVDDGVISVCICDFHNTAHPAYMLM